MAKLLKQLAEAEPDLMVSLRMVVDAETARGPQPSTGWDSRSPRLVIVDTTPGDAARRVMIWVDMEGIAGIEAWDQVTGGKPQYEEGRRLMTGEVNAAVRGAKAAGADDIIVVDCHGAGGSYNFKSLITERLEGGATYVLGHAWCRYVEPLKEGCDAALLVGAHAMAGTPDGVMCHTSAARRGTTPR